MVGSLGPYHLGNVWTLPARLTQLGGCCAIVVEVKSGREVGAGRFTGTRWCVRQLYHSIDRVVVIAAYLKKLNGLILREKAR